MGILTRATRNIAKRKARAALAIIAIAVAMAVMISIPAGLEASQSAAEELNARMNVDYEAQAAEIEKTSSLIIVGNTGSSEYMSGGSGGRSPGSSASSVVNSTVQEALASVDGIGAVIPYVTGTEGMPEPGSFTGIFDGGAPSEGERPDISSMRDALSDVYKVLGVSLTEEHIANYSVLPTILEGRTLAVGETGSVLLTQNLTEYFDAGVGDTVTIQDTEFTVVGIYESTASQGDRTVYMNIEDAQEIYGLGSSVSYLYVYVEDVADVSTIATAIEVEFSDVSVSTMSDRLSDLAQMQEMSQQTLASASATLSQTEAAANQEMIIAVVATALIILFVMLYTVKERTKEIGVLKTLGFSKRAVIAQFVLEGVIIAAIAGAVGAVMGWVGSSALASILVPSTDTTAGASGFGGQGLSVASLSIQPDPAWILAAFFLVVGLGALGSLYPAWRASRTRPVEALKNE